MNLCAAEGALAAVRCSVHQATSVFSWVVQTTPLLVNLSLVQSTSYLNQSNRPCASNGLFDALSVDLTLVNLTVWSRLRLCN
jgi:hypothetical protein